jgi:cyclin-dependent kinase 7
MKRRSANMSKVFTLLSLVIMCPEADIISGKKLGEGTYAIVYKGHLRHDPTKLFAIKKIKVNADFQDGLSLDAIREVKFLQELNHPNIIKLHSVFSTKDQNLNLVLEYLPLGDLEVLIRDNTASKIFYSPGDMKAWMAMLCRGVYFCHQNFVLHRDIKPNNLLIAADGEIKLADFGLARSFSDPFGKMTCNVITRWYRPPELFLGARYYGGAVDVWSVGCVFAEIVMRNPFIPAETDLAQLTKIYELFGHPTDATWPGVSKLKEYYPPPDLARGQLPPRPAFMTKADWLQWFGSIGDLGIDLLQKMLIMDPRKRLTAREILEHPYWTADPRPTKKENLPKKGGGEERIGVDLKRRGGELGEEDGRPKDKVARKLDFSTMSKK